MKDKSREKQLAFLHKKGDKELFILHQLGTGFAFSILLDRHYSCLIEYAQKRVVNVNPVDVVHNVIVEIADTDQSPWQSMSWLSWAKALLKIEIDKVENKDTEALPTILPGTNENTYEDFSVETRDLIAVLRKSVTVTEFRLLLLRGMYQMLYREAGEELGLSKGGVYKKYINLITRLQRRFGNETNPIFV